MKQAITTKFIGATNSRGSRIKATAARGSVTIPYPHELNSDGAHIMAARALVLKFIEDDFKEYQTDPKKNPWNTKFVSGWAADGVGVHVYA